MLTAFTTVHVLLSLIGIVSGLATVPLLLGMTTRDRGTSLFLWSTVATSVTGFGFPFHHFLPSHAVGVLSLAILAVVLFARNGRRLQGPWRWIFAIGAVAALYFNVFVLIVQAFLKVPALKALAPTQSEPPFAIAQGVVLVAFTAIGVMAALRFRPQSIPPLSSAGAA